MACNPEVLKHVPLFSMLDEEESEVLASQVELKKFVPRQRIYKAGDGGGQAYVMVSGRVRVTTVDEDHQEVVVDEPAHGAFLGSRRCWSRQRTKRQLRRWRKRSAWK
jgi:CRP-like cAMP-binding protein